MEAKTGCTEFIGDSAKMQAVKRLTHKLGRSTHPVLIFGETGTGKEIVARLIHQVSGRGPFVVIDCTSLTETLTESELFGHVQGAFTGASRERQGLIEQADGGSAFFDEVGELPLDTQAQLLRVLQQQEFRRVGSTRLQKIAFRTIAATNRSLEAAVEAGSFRRDLFYRLNVTSIQIPPLRERKEDIHALVHHFLRRLQSSHVFTEESYEALLAYEWPGNVRELEHLVWQLVAIQTGPRLGPEVLPRHIRTSVNAPKAQTEQPVDIPGEVGPLACAGIVPLSQVERSAILAALKGTRWDFTKAARALGIGRTTLYRRVREYGLLPEQPLTKAAGCC